MISVNKIYIILIFVLKLISYYIIIIFILNHMYNHSLGVFENIIR